MYSRILIATDGSELSTRGLLHGLDLAAKLGVAASVVTVTEHWSPFDMAGEAQRGVTNPVGEYEAAARAAGRRGLDAAMVLAGERGVAAEPVHVTDSGAAEGIVRTAAEKGCDLIVMASHGRRGLNRVLLGSQAMEVVTESKVPVLIVR